MKKPSNRILFLALLVSIIFAASAGNGLLYTADNMLADALYQQRQPTQESVMVIGIDDQALEDFGPYPWPRDIMAMAIETLNQDPENRPAAIGIDVLYAGETDPAADRYLVEAAGAHENVVLAAIANYGNLQIVETEQENVFTNDTFFVESFELPFPALSEVTYQGHINAMYDKDAVLRHSLLYVELPDGTLFPSFNYQLYRLYAQTNGLDPDRVPQTNSRHFWYVPYAGIPGDYFVASVSDLIAGNITSDMFKDAVVLIGPYAPGLTDDYYTPIDKSVKMYGVEYQANVLDALIRGEYKTELSTFPQSAILFLLSFACFVVLIDRKVWQATAIWLVLSLGSIGLCMALYAAGYVAHPLWVPLAITILYVATVAVNYIRASLEKRRVRNTFMRYVAPEIVNEILKEGTDVLELGGKMCDIAVLFVDIRGFTPMSEVLTPPEVVEILNKYLTLTSSSIMNNGGTLDKFVGDATMAFWGAPLPQDDYIFKAAKTAMDMVEGSKALSEELQERYGRTVSFGIGIHCGQAVVGNIGATNRMDYTAIGDTVNTSARLESNAPGGKILISRAVADALSGRILTTSLGDTIKLKGKSEGFEILTLEAIVDK